LELYQNGRQPVCVRTFQSISAQTKLHLNHQDSNWKDYLVSFLGRLLNMKLADIFRYDGKHVLVVGGATGMGAAVAELAKELGGVVTVMDYAPIPMECAAKIQIDIAHKNSIDSALAQIAEPINAVFCCAGVANCTPGIEKINFVGHRYLLECLVEKGNLSRGSSVCFIASSAGLGWETNFAELSEVLDIADFEAAAEWFRKTGRANYSGTKQAVCAYVAREAFAFLQKGIRINAICPGPTDTPLAQANKDQWLGMGSDFRAAAGVEPSTAMEQALPMAFLCSDAAAAITGTTMVADLGWFNAGRLHTFPGATPIAEHIMGSKIPKPRSADAE